MPIRVYFSEKASEDLQQIFDWYQDKNSDAGDKFVAAVDDCVEKIIVTPHAASIRYDDYRCKLIKNFPYLLHYTYDESNQVVSIHRIFHTSRKPFWDK